MAGYKLLGGESVELGYLRPNTPAERRRLAGQADRGDIAGVPGVAIEAKNTRALDLARAVDEATVEAGNAGVGVGVAWIKRRGKPSAADGYVVMAGETFVALLAEAGYR